MTDTARALTCAERFHHGASQDGKAPCRKGPPDVVRQITNAGHVMTYRLTADDLEACGEFREQARPAPALETRAPVIETRPPQLDRRPAPAEARKPAPLPQQPAKAAQNGGGDRDRERRQREHQRGGR